MEEDRQRLVEFLDAVREVLDRIVASPRFFNEDVYEDVTELWAEAKRLRLIENVQEVLQGEATDLDFPPTLDTRLERVGLTGRILGLKLRIFEKLRTRIFNPKNVRKVLGVMDTILGSLTAAISIAEPLTEVKDIIERLIEDEA